MKLRHGWLAGLVVVALGAWPAVSQSEGPVAHASASCSDYPNQAAAQRAADTRDADGDGIYCESLPCPCSSASGGGTGETGANPAGCTRPSTVQRLVFSRVKYRHIRAHFLAAVRRGWPRILVLNRPHASDRRDRLLASIPTRAGYDRDEYPPAVGRGRGAGLTRGSDPTGWRADVRYVASAENRSHGSSGPARVRRGRSRTTFQGGYGVWSARSAGSAATSIERRLPAAVVCSRRTGRDERVALGAVNGRVPTVNSSANAQGS